MLYPGRLDSAATQLQKSQFVILCVVLVFCATSCGTYCPKLNVLWCYDPRDRKGKAIDEFKYHQDTL